MKNTRKQGCYKKAMSIINSCINVSQLKTCKALIKSFFLLTKDPEYTKKLIGMYDIRKDQLKKKLTKSFYIC